MVKASNPGDLIAFIGTQTKPTRPEDQGRLLGIAEIGRIPVDTLDVLDAAVLQPEAFKPDGKIKWPKSLPMIRAWEFIAKPRVTAILKAQLSYEATTRAVPLDDEDQAAVLNLSRDEIMVPEFEIIGQHRNLNDALTVSRLARGPTPSSWSGTVVRNVDVSAVTYALRFGKRIIWKIGHTHDLAIRVADINKHIPQEVLKERWHQAFVQHWNDQVSAYSMEQRVLKILDHRRTEGERVLCSEEELESAWVQALVPGSDGG